MTDYATPNGAFFRPMTWRDRLRNRLFPIGLPPEIPSNVPAEVIASDGDVIHTDVRIQFGWIDRLRVLLSGRVLVRVRTGAMQRVDTVWSRSAASPVWRHDGED